MAFTVLDLNDNGKINKNEFKSIAQSMERQHVMMKNVHEDTEEITQRFLMDFVSFGATHFAQLDANNDGGYLHSLRLTVNSNKSSCVNSLCLSLSPHSKALYHPPLLCSPFLLVSSCAYDFGTRANRVQVRTGQVRTGCLMAASTLHVHAITLSAFHAACPFQSRCLFIAITVPPHAGPVSFKEVASWIDELEETSDGVSAMEDQLGGGNKTQYMQHVEDKGYTNQQR